MSTTPTQRPPARSDPAGPHRAEPDTRGIIRGTLIACLVVIGVAAGVSLVLEPLWRSLRLSAAGPLACPTAYGGGSDVGWVPDGPLVPGGSRQLVPSAVPTAAVVCRYPGPDSTAPRVGVRLTGPLTALPTDLYVPPSAENDACAGVGMETNHYLLGLDYPDGRVWVSSTVDGGCHDVTNGAFSTSADVGGLLADAVSASGWVPTTRAPCAGPAGRYGEQDELVPGTPTAAYECQSGAPVAVAAGLVAPLAAAFDSLPAHRSGFMCGPSDNGPGNARTIEFQYATGPAVRLSLGRHCRPGVMGGLLEADDPSPVWAVIDGSEPG